MAKKQKVRTGVNGSEGSSSPWSPDAAEQNGTMIMERSNGPVNHHDSGINRQNYNCIIIRQLFTLKGYNYKYNIPSFFINKKNCVKEI